MTKFVIKIEDKKVSVSCKNHAKSDVCRGVSALVYALANKMRLEHARGNIGELAINLESGTADIGFVYKEEAEDAVRSALETVALGMQAIAARYPEELEIKIH